MQLLRCFKVYFYTVAREFCVISAVFACVDMAQVLLLCKFFHLFYHPAGKTTAHSLQKNAWFEESFTSGALILVFRVCSNHSELY